MKFAESIEKPFKDMVCALEENLALFIVQDASNTAPIKAKFYLPASSTVGDVFQEVARLLDCHQDSFNLVLQKSESDYMVPLNVARTEPIDTAGFKVGPHTQNTLIITPTPGFEISKPEDLRMGPSNSPSSSGDYETPIVPPPPPPPSAPSSSGDFSCPPIIREDVGFVGLVNQAMTCYLNSLLQALYMTPEFRNAMYNWEFDGNAIEESKSIPYQLQKLFLNLQTSKKSAVETTELTRSFGWDSWEAWQQHDIQELCRVMFDTLEQKFKNTKQADLINRLYEGKMIDYVKCLECSTEKSREDTFLDIPLPVRPFGSNISYGSVEDALSAFAQPETLDGNNQYHCETCNKKCNAHKGLKFTKFPYLLTLHLKRFDFDFNTLHRIKLNDRVSFPEILNLNSLIPTDKQSNEKSGDDRGKEAALSKCYLSRKRDSIAAVYEENSHNADEVKASKNARNEIQADEGIDIGQQNEYEKNRQNLSESGPYIYELFSIMIHSGSAAGGHYYAYIKDFKGGEWYCFNDQNVCRITYDDIRRTYGGGPVRNYYSGTYSSSTNAYMLMYRQIDKERNVLPMTVEEFPDHIKFLHQKLEQQKELERLMREREFETCKMKVFCHYPHQNVISETKMTIESEYTLKETTHEIYERLNLEKLVPLERCRLVSYDRTKDAIECSFEGREDEAMGDIYMQHGKDYLMEIREEDEEFEMFRPETVNTIVILVNIPTEDIIGPTIIRANLRETVKQYKDNVASELKLPKDLLYIILEKFSNEPRLLQNDDCTLNCEGFYDSIKVYIAAGLGLDELEHQRPFVMCKLHKIIDRFEHVISLHLTLPEIDHETLDRLQIPPLEDVGPTCERPIEVRMPTTQSRGTSPNPVEANPQPLPEVEEECCPAGHHSDQSASEDSSLTDSERTIVGEAQGEGLAQLSPNSSPGGSDHTGSTSENDGNGGFQPANEYYRGNAPAENWDDDDEEGAEEEVPSRTYNYYFKAIAQTENNTNQKVLKVLVDKRMNVGTFKQYLEPNVGVPVDNFKICRSFSKHSDFAECTRLSETLDVYKENEKLTVKLGRALKEGEYLGNVYLLDLNNDKPIKYLFEWIISNGTPVTVVKREILNEMKRKCAIEIPFERCRLRKKNWTVPLRPYLDGTTFENLEYKWALYVQELPGKEPVTSPNQKLLIVRQLCLSTRECKPFEEIVLETNTVAECKEKLSEISGIPAEYIETTKAPGFFPCLNLSVLTSYLEVGFHPSIKVTNVYEEGHVILYRDCRDKPKFLPVVNNRKDRRSRMLQTNKERALKIFLDSTSSQKEGSDVD